MGAACCKIALRSPPVSLQGFAYSQHTMVVCWGGGLNKYQPLAPDRFQPPLLRRSGFQRQVKRSVRLRHQPLWRTNAVLCLCHWSHYPIGARIHESSEERNMAGKLEGKIALVTGGNVGLGQVAALTLAR